VIGQPNPIFAVGLFELQNQGAVLLFGIAQEICVVEFFRYRFVITSENCGS
jgi:hypothetical protein